MANHGTRPPQQFGSQRPVQPKNTGVAQGQVQDWEDLSHILPEGGPEAGFQLRHEQGPEEGSGSIHLHGPGGKWLARVAYTGKNTDDPQWVFHTGDQMSKQPRVHTPVVNHLARALGHVFQPRPQFQNLLDEAHESESWNRDLDGAESMLKAEGKKKGGTWAGRSILDGEDAKGLEAEAALREFRDRRPRAEAEEDAHRQYRHGHHQKAAAHHLRGMKMAQASGQTEEAHKHSVMYALHLQKLGHDPYKEPPSEVRALMSKEPDQKQYRFRDHGGDGFILEKGEELSPGLVLKKAWPKDDQENSANAGAQQVMEDAVLEQGGQKKDVSGQAQKQVMRRYQQTIPDQGDDGRDYGKLENFLDRETAVLDWNAAHSPPGEGPAPHDTVDQGPHPANLHQVERHKGLPAHDRAGELSFWGRINQAVRLKPSPVPDFKKVKKAWPKTDQENSSNAAADQVMEDAVLEQGGAKTDLPPGQVQTQVRDRNEDVFRASMGRTPGMDYHDPGPTARREGTQAAMNANWYEDLEHTGRGAITKPDGSTGWWHNSTPTMPANPDVTAPYTNSPADQASEKGFWGMLTQSLGLKKAWPKTDQENEANRAGFVRESPPTEDRLMEQGLGTKTEHTSSTNDHGDKGPANPAARIQRESYYDAPGGRGSEERRQWHETFQRTGTAHGYNLGTGRDDRKDVFPRGVDPEIRADRLNTSQFAFDHPQEEDTYPWRRGAMGVQDRSGGTQNDRFWRMVGAVSDATAKQKKPLKVGIPKPVKKQEDRTNPGVKPHGLVGNPAVPAPPPMGSGLTNTRISDTSIRPKPLPEGAAAPPSLKITPQKPQPGGLVPPPAPIGAPVTPATPHRLDLGPGMAGHPRQISAPAIKPVAPLGAWKSETPSLWQKLVKSLPKTHAENQELAAHDQVLQDHLRETFPFETDTEPTATVPIVAPAKGKGWAAKYASTRGTEQARDANNRANWRTYSGDLGDEQGWMNSYRHWSAVDDAAELAAGNEGAKPAFKPGDKVMRIDPEDSPWVGMVMPHEPSEYETEDGQVLPHHPNGPSWRDHDIDGPGHYYNVRWTSDRGTKHDDWLHQQLLKPAGGWPDPIKKAWPKDEQENQANAAAQPVMEDAILEQGGRRQEIPVDQVSSHLKGKMRYGYYLPAGSEDHPNASVQTHTAARANYEQDGLPPDMGNPAPGPHRQSIWPEHSNKGPSRNEKSFWIRIGRQVGLRKAWPKTDQENQDNARGFLNQAPAMDAAQEQGWKTDETLDSESLQPRIGHHLNARMREGFLASTDPQAQGRIYDAADANANQDEAARAQNTGERYLHGEGFVSEPSSPYAHAETPWGLPLSPDQKSDAQGMSAYGERAFWHRLGRSIGINPMTPMTKTDLEAKKARAEARGQVGGTCGDEIAAKLAMKKAWPQKIARKDKGGTHPMHDPAAAATHAVLQDSIQERGDVREVRPTSTTKRVAQEFRNEGHAGAYDVGTMGGDLPLDRPPSPEEVADTGNDRLDRYEREHMVEDRMQDYAENAPPEDASDLAGRVGEPRLSRQNRSTQTMTEHPRIVSSGLENYSIGAGDAIQEHQLWSSLRNELKKVRPPKIKKAWPKSDQENQANKAGFPLGDKAITDPGEQAVAQDHLNATMGGNATQAPAGDLPGLAEKNREILGQWEEPADPEMGTCANCGLDHMDHMMNDLGSEICPPNLDGSDAGTEYRDNWAGSQGQMLSAATYDHTGYGNTVPPPHPGISQAVLTNEKGLGQNPREPTDASRWGWTEGRASLDLDQRFWSILGRAAGVNKGG